MRNDPDPMAYYYVKVNYPKSPRKTTSPVVPAEGELATSITVEWQQLKRKKGNPKQTEKIPGTGIGPTPVDNVPPYPQT